MLQQSFTYPNKPINRHNKAHSFCNIKPRSSSLCSNSYIPEVYNQTQPIINLHNENSFNNKNNGFMTKEKIDIIPFLYLSENVVNTSKELLIKQRNKNNDYYLENSKKGSYQKNYLNDFQLLASSVFDYLNSFEYLCSNVTTFHVLEQERFDKEVDKICFYIKKTLNIILRVIKKNHEYEKDLYQIINNKYGYINVNDVETNNVLVFINNSNKKLEIEINKLINLIYISCSIVSEYNKHNIPDNIDKKLLVYLDFLSSKYINIFSQNLGQNDNDKGDYSINVSPYNGNIIKPTMSILNHIRSLSEPPCQRIVSYVTNSELLMNNYNSTKNDRKSSNFHNYGSYNSFIQDYYKETNQEDNKRPFRFNNEELFKNNTFNGISNYNINKNQYGNYSSLWNGDEILKKKNSFNSIYDARLDTEMPQINTPINVFYSQIDYLSNNGREVFNMLDSSRNILFQLTNNYDIINNKNLDDMKNASFDALENAK
ncbi:hypothetical protein BCR32DRAFT_303891 [Anaeromyces robustus]|uniref:Uncharacterized protein n=1 Tax=Anaeromyces robustus TaxID=1754192 RepID=A0A1Y1XQJ0_9FUNG|nr:hypothetical protein BCR32DRAFT_303891 [Anaeromyces robustus]|eukprot:ORX88020.1 hypothetical protein BCR32DRAFT_303891 [Anaeromyces robustus]